MNTSVALLVIGELNEAGAISLKSIGKITHQKICVAANKSGVNWITKAADQAMLKSFCFHGEILDNFEFPNLKLKSKYSEYRTTEFRHLTLLKWDLILDIFNKHPDINHAIFSDLDIFWAANPITRIKQIHNSNTSMLVQDNSTKERPDYVCTGIMSWQRSNETLETLALIRQYQSNKLKKGDIQDDEDSFNQYFRAGKINQDVVPLPPNEFVIGRNFPRIFKQSISPKNVTVYCFHANYALGLTEKLQFLLAVKNYYSNGKIPWKELFLFYIAPIHEKHERIKLKATQLIHNLFKK